MIRCDKCGEYNGDTRETCFQCGESLNNPQGVERRVMCSQCSSVYTTTARHCPRCGGLLREFSGSVEMARMIKEEREEAVDEPSLLAKMLCFLLPGYAIYVAIAVLIFGNANKGKRLLMYSGIAIAVQFIVVLMLAVILVAAGGSRRSYDPNNLPEVVVTSEKGGTAEEVVRKNLDSQP